MADSMEIQRAIEVCHQEDNHQIILFQCTSLYPAPSELSNLKSMITMKEQFQTVVGYSDHTIGDLIPLASVAMGAAIIEKHFTLDKTLQGPDHSFAMEPHELKMMVEKIREVEKSLGNGEKNGPRPEELSMYNTVRRSIHAAKSIKVGEVITENMLTTKRPGFGIEPYRKNEIIGATAQVNIKKDHWIDWDMIQE